MAGGQTTRSSMQPNPAEPPASEDWTELNDELSTIEQHCQLFADMLNASIPGKTTQSDRQVLKVTSFVSLFGSSPPCHFHGVSE